MRSGFVILNYNSWQLSEKLAVKVAAMPAVDKIVIVDNHSTDNSVEGLERIENEKIQVVMSEKNGGYSYGNNFGVDVLRNSGGGWKWSLLPIRMLTLKNRM